MVGTPDPNKKDTNIVWLGMVGTPDPDDDPDTNAKIHISILGKLLFLIIIIKQNFIKLFHKVRSYATIRKDIYNQKMKIAKLLS